MSVTEKALGLAGLRVLEVEEGVGEVVVRVESTNVKAFCRSCRRRAQAQDRVEVHLRDAHCFGRAARLVLSKRRWRCRWPACARHTWTEKIAGVVARQVLTVRAGVEVCCQVGQLCRPVTSVADEYCVVWDTGRKAVVLHAAAGRRSAAGVGRVQALGVDEHSFLAATREHHTTVVELVARNPSNLTVTLHEVNDKRLLRSVPSENEVAVWIEQAKTLPSCGHLLIRRWYEGRTRHSLFWGTHRGSFRRRFQRRRVRPCVNPKATRSRQATGSRYLHPRA